MDVRRHWYAREGAQRAGRRDKDTGVRALARMCGRRERMDMHVHASQGDVWDVRARERARVHGCGRTCAALALKRGRVPVLEHVGRGAQSSTRQCRHAQARGAGVRLRVYCSPESTIFTRNHLNNLKQ
ncbi:hypothetical protein CDL15_Pgr013006 [Punica granatum]|nr:hypothetical protein CDL15_Pgr013006 [Punica granatum]